MREAFFLTGEREHRDRFEERIEDLPTWEVKGLDDVFIVHLFLRQSKGIGEYSAFAMVSIYRSLLSQLRKTTKKSSR